MQRGAGLDPGKEAEQSITKVCSPTSRSVVPHRTPFTRCSWESAAAALWAGRQRAVKLGYSTMPFSRAKLMLAASPVAGRPPISKTGPRSVGLDKTPAWPRLKSLPARLTRRRQFGS